MQSRGSEAEASTVPGGQSRGSEAEASTVPGGEGFGRAGLGKLRGRRLSPVELLEKLAALVPLPRVHLVRYGGCLAQHSHLRGAIIPTPRQQGLEEQKDRTASHRWSWARLLKRVFALDMARCP